MLQGYKFAATQSGTTCVCGDTYGQYGRTDGCNLPCAGDYSQVCGGENTNSVMQVLGMLQRMQIMHLFIITLHIHLEIGWKLQDFSSIFLAKEKQKKDFLDDKWTGIQVFANIWAGLRDSK